MGGGGHGTFTRVDERMKTKSEGGADCCFDFQTGERIGLFGCEPGACAVVVCRNDSAEREIRGIIAARMSVFRSLELHRNRMISGLRCQYFLSGVKRGGFDKAQQQH